MRIYLILKSVFDGFKESFIVSRLHKLEKYKFKDDRRKNIYKNVKLSSKQKKEIDLLYKDYYGKKISYIWHKHYTAYTGRFDAKYIPELIYFPEFERYMNSKREYIRVFEDKNILPMLAQAAGVKTPTIMYSNVNGLMRNARNEIIEYEQLIYELSNIGECFIKPSIDTSSGVGCSLLNISGGVDLYTNKSVNQIITEKGNNWIIQKKIVCSKSIREIYNRSVNTFRVITYRWKDKIYIAPIIMRIGQGGSCLDNAHAGGMFIAIDNNGMLHKTAFTEFKRTFNYHPDTEVCFDGYEIQNFSKVIEAAQRCHMVIPQLGVINWDFTIDEREEAVLIEANICGGSIWLIQMAHGKGVFGENTQEILKWMKYMRGLPYYKRKELQFGEYEK